MEMDFSSRMRRSVFTSATNAKVSLHESLLLVWWGFGLQFLHTSHISKSWLLLLRQTTFLKTHRELDIGSRNNSICRNVRSSFQACQKVFFLTARFLSVSIKQQLRYEKNPEKVEHFFFFLSKETSFRLREALLSW